MARGLKILGWIGLAAVGACAGIGLAFHALDGRGEGQKAVGPYSWHTSPHTGDAHQDLLSRAKVAKVGIWALPPTEVVYYGASKDADGKLLDRNCVYEIAGQGDLPARWWSISLYRNRYWVDNPADRYSFSKTTVTRDAGDHWKIRIAGAPQPGDWIPMGPKPGKFDLAVRLYMPDASVRSAPAATPLPPVRRISCA